ncbi:MAG: amino acid permease [Megasphaera sp.]|nr:amino acid permease [Megasphaera sp.]MCH4187843.1 amino acid permease [Megasphaera sp.]MCH4218086.1 amino acid permease [Megasphaera sp.]
MDQEVQTNVVHEELKRELKERHIQLMALGGCIGVGLFLGSATSIQKAGPAVLLSYLFIGIITYIVIRAMGELTVEYPVSGSFCAHAYQFISPLAGFIAGWNYWYAWLVACMAEITAVGVYVQLWMPDSPQWVTCLIVLAAMTIANLISVALYGEFEFWFALIKVLTIIFLICTGCAMIFFGFANGGIAIGLSNLYSHGGFLPHGFSGIFDTFIMVMYAFTGMEVIGVTAGEAANPGKTLSSAINKCLIRIMLFYILSLAVIMAIYPWDQLGTQGSPFVMVFEKLGIGSAANLINFVVITAALSACNTGIYSASRMLYNQSLQHTAPKVFSRVTKHGVPYAGVIVSSSIMLVGVVLNYFLPATVFEIVTAATAFGCLVTWVFMLTSQRRFRQGLTAKEIKNIRYKMPFYPYSSYVAYAFFIVIFISALFRPETRIGLYATGGWLFILCVAYYGFGLNKRAGSVTYERYEAKKEEISSGTAH